MKMRILLGSLLVVLYTAGAVHASAILRQIPLSRKTTLTVPAAYDFEFRLWTSADPADAAGVQVWAEPKRIKLGTKTLSHALGSVVPFDTVPVDFSQQLWVEVAVLKRGEYVPLRGARTRLDAHPYALHSEEAGALTGPIVMTQAPLFNRFSATTTPTLMIPVGHIFGATADNGIIILGLDGPAAIGGVNYRLSQVEWCLSADTTNGGMVTGAVVYHDAGSLLTVAVSDATDRTVAGCYALAVPAANPRGYSLALALTGQTTNLTQAGVVLGNVRTTWVAAGP
jgi:hypothetical protein